MRAPAQGSNRRGALPTAALVVSLGALAVPSLAAFGSPSWMEDTSALLIWMTPLLPAFLLAYHRGWAGAALALATGMASLAVAQVAFLVGGVEPPEWTQLLVVVGVYLLFAFGIGSLAELLHRERDAARELALTDSLTGLPNRRHAEVYLEAAFAGAQRGSDLSVVIFDLDRFKGFNDRWGHAAGDAVLSTFGGVLRRLTRRSDISARLGGEEFVSVLSHTDGEGAQAFAERVRCEIGTMELPWGRVTVSAGVARFEEGMGSPDILLAAADRALYRAKTEGRDRVVLASPHVGPAAAAGLAGEQVPPLRGSGSRRVAVVDDDPSVAHALGKILKRRGYAVSVFLDPREFLAGLEAGGDPPDVLLTDVVMPGMNGLTLVEEVGRKGFEPPVIFMSGYVHGEVTWPGIPGGVTAFLEKPVDPDALQAAVGGMMA